MTNDKDDLNIKELYSKQCILPKEDFIKTYNIDINGLSNKKVIENIKNYGNNTISKTKPKRWYNYLFESLFTPFNLILLGIVCILCYTDLYLQTPPSYANILVILILISASTLLDFIEEYRSNKAAEKLKEMVATTTTVIRNKKETKIQIKDIVQNDIVLLSAGSLVPADLRIIEAKDLYVSQSSLTGESDSVKKEVNSNLKEDELDSISDLDTICFMGTNVISGSAKGVVI